jgi:hypothetical protein
MKSIELRSSDEWDDKIILRAVAEQSSDPRGMDYAHVRRSIRLLDALDAADRTLELEDADHAYLVERLASFRWARADRRIVDLVERVKAAPDRGLAR